MKTDKELDAIALEIMKKLENCRSRRNSHSADVQCSAWCMVRISEVAHYTTCHDNDF